MAVVTVKSAAITNRDATPPVINDGRLEKANIVEAIGYVTATNGDSINSAYALCSVPSSARISSVLLDYEALGASAAVKVGVFKNTVNGGGAGQTVANGGAGNFFANALSVTTAAQNVDITNQAGTYTIDKAQMPIWQAIGLTTDPNTTFDICVTVTAAIAATGKLGMRVRYADNSN